MTGKIAVDLGNVQKTLFLPLWGRAVESKKDKPLLVDKTAQSILERVDYDFATIAANINPLTQLAWIMRSLCVDGVIKAFLQKYPHGTIVNVGCGMDTTFDRVDNGTLRWYDLDLPDVIALRQQLIPAGERRKFIAASFLELSWLEQIEVSEQVLFVSAGVFYYFTAAQIKGFLTRLADKFPGCEVLFDVASPRGVRVANKQVITASGLDEKSYLTWGVESPQVITGWDKRFKLRGTHNYFGNRLWPLGLKTWALGLLSDFLQIQYMVHLELK